jgi:hypothetical protein
MPIRLIDPTKPIRWVHPLERAGIAPTVFNIICLTEGKARELRNTYIASPDLKAPDVNGFKMAVFLQCVKSIDNVTMPGDALPRTIAAPEDIRYFLDCLPVELVAPIYEAIQNLTELDAGTIKNSEESPASPHS